MNRFFVGLDLGQSHDFTAIAVVERVESVGELDKAVWAPRKEVAARLRYLERLPLGTPYPEVVGRAGQVVRSPQVAGACHLIVDATGVGRPVVDMLRAERLPCRLVPALITAGYQENQTNGYYHVPKRDLITGLRVLLEQQGLQIAARLELGRTLVTELAEMRVKVSMAGNEQYGAWREGTHDDLVLAVALACWGMRKAYPGAMAGRHWGRPVLGL
ncbi:MAG: hypothetical protein ABSH50_27875 [Bryobacteraceae bacterium]|jgi:hypothetical protein